MNGLFRGKRIDNGEWVVGYYGQFHNRPNDMRENSHQIFVLMEDATIFGSAIGGLWYVVDPETIGQYTGLDIKNTKVFDGDIIDVFGAGRKMFVFWNEETFSWEIADICTQPNEVNHLTNCISLGEISVEACFENEIQSKVIGNIHDNPELTMREEEDDELQYKF